MFAYNLSSQHSYGGSLTNNNNTKCRKCLASDIMYCTLVSALLDPGLPGENVSAHGSRFFRLSNIDF